MAWKIPRDLVINEILYLKHLKLFYGITDKTTDIGEYIESQEFSLLQRLSAINNNFRNNIKDILTKLENCNCEFGLNLVLKALILKENILAELNGFYMFRN